jgi:hypothetical protein
VGGDVWQAHLCPDAASAVLGAGFQTQPLGRMLIRRPSNWARGTWGNLHIRGIRSVACAMQLCRCYLQTC